MTPNPKPLVLAALFAAVAAAAASAEPLDAAQSQARALAGASRREALSCRPLPRALSCAVAGETKSRAVALAGDAFRVFYPGASSKVEVLTPDISPDYDVYYQFDRAEFEALLRGARPSVAGSLEEKVERTEPRSTPATCSVSAAAPSADYYGLTGEVDRATKALTTSRAPGSAAPIDVSRGPVVDERCGETAAPLRYSDNYYVTPAHYWGEDILQLPQSALRVDSAPFQANLHSCQYDGEWHSSEDVGLLCTLTPR